MDREPVFRIEGLRKSFGPVNVLDGVTLGLHAGTVTALMGANGAGKSTLVKIVSGVYRRDGGRMILAGAAFEPESPAEAMRAGVVTVHQNINDGVVADLDVATNLTLDRLNGKGAPLFFRPLQVRRQARAVAERMGLTLDLTAPVRELTLADRQMVAIARAMAHEPRVLVLDEPTSSLSSAEAERLFALIDRLRSSGVAILYISHRMSDIRRIADSIVALRDGSVSGVFADAPLDYEGAVNAMLGRSTAAGHVTPRAALRPIFAAHGLQIAPGAEPFDLSLGAGEVVAVTGLVGVGKSRLGETLFGLRRPIAGKMTLRGSAYRPRSPAAAIESGVFMLAKDRGENGIVGDFNIARNISLPFLSRLSSLSVLRKAREQRQAREQIAALGIVCRSPADQMDALSGGNQQKVMVARWMTQPCHLFVLDEPFQGIDIAARRDMTAKLRASAGERATVVFLTELDEALETADRILVMSEHTIVGEHVNADIRMERLYAEIAGQATGMPRSLASHAE